MTNTTQDTIKEIRELIEENNKTIAVLEYKTQIASAIVELSKIIKGSM